MKNVTIRLSDEKVKTLDSEADDLDLSRAEYLRELIEQGRESRAVESDLAESRQEIERLKRELRATNARQEDVGDLVEYVEEERALQQRERERRDAALPRRMYWYFFGRGD